MKSAHFITESRQEFTPFQQKVIVLIIAKLDLGKSKRNLSFKARSLMEGIEPKMTYDDLRQETLRLVGKVYEIEEKERLLQVSILEAVEFVKGEGIIKVLISNELLPYLLSIKQSYRLNTLKHLISFRSKFSVLLYQILLISPEKIIEVRELKSLLNIPTKYKDYATFKTRVILQAQKELHLTDLAFTFQEIKEGRKIVKIAFKVQPLSQLYLNNAQDQLLKKIVREFGITTLQAQKIVLKFIPEEIHAILYKIKERHRTGQIKTSLGAYTIGVFDRLLKGE